MTIAFTTRLVPILQEQKETAFEEKPFFGYILFVFIIVFLILAVYLFYIFFREPVKRPKHSFRVSTTHLVVFIVIFLIFYFMRAKEMIPGDQNMEEMSIKNETQEKYESKTTVPGGIESIKKEAKTNTISRDVFLILGVILVCLFIFRIPKKKSQEDKERFVERLYYKGNEAQKNEAIVEYYKKAVLLLNERGIPYKDSFTHRELESVVEEKEKEIIIKSFAELTKLFEKCKYSPKNINENDVDKAMKLYKKIDQQVSKNA